MSATADDVLAATDPLATVDDVRGEISTRLDDTTIENRIESAYEEIALANDLGTLSNLHRKKLETYYTCYKIRAWRERDMQKGSRESGSITFDGSPLEELERQVQRLDPSGELLPGEKDDPTGTKHRTASYGSGSPHSSDGIGRDGRDPYTHRETIRRRDDHDHRRS